jgi:type VI secretion system protein ImpF
MVYAPVADPERKSRLSPPLMYVFRSTDKVSARTAELAHSARSYSPAPSDRGATAVKPQRVAIAERALQSEVADDMASLLSHVSLDSSVDLTDFAFVQKSILNFGFPDIANRSIDELERADLDGEICEILKIYEPRLIASTLRVARDASVDKSRLQIRYLVRSDLACRPLNIPVEFVADVDVTTGKIQLAGAKG